MYLLIGELGWALRGIAEMRQSHHVMASATVDQAFLQFHNFTIVLLF
jgi:hypothetical protein